MQINVCDRCKRPLKKDIEKGEIRFTIPAKESPLLQGWDEFGII